MQTYVFRLALRRHYCGADVTYGGCMTVYVCVCFVVQLSDVTAADQRDAASKRHGPRRPAPSQSSVTATGATIGRLRNTVNKLVNTASSTTTPRRDPISIATRFAFRQTPSIDLRVKQIFTHS